MNELIIKAGAIVPGDIVETNTGDKVKVTRVTLGMIRGAVLIHWADGWHHLPKRDRVTVWRKRESQPAHAQEVQP